MKYVIKLEIFLNPEVTQIGNLLYPAIHLHVHGVSQCNVFPTLSCNFYEMFVRYFRYSLILYV